VVGLSGEFLKASQKTWLKKQFGGQVVFEAPMSQYTTFGIGGPANIVTVKTDEQLKTLIRWANDEDLEPLILGAGSNLLVSDSGIDGLVVKLVNGYTSITRSAGALQKGQVGIAAGAGVLLKHLGKYALDHGLSGLCFTLGIPGTVGGALRMNAGAWGETMADRVVGITILTRTGEIRRLGAPLSFSYRNLEIEKGAIILRGKFQLESADRETLRKRAAWMQRKRAASQPLSLPSAGSVFRNPEGGPSAGELIDKAGLKGTRVGAAEISAKHANFIVNRGQAKASDVLALMDKIQATVSKKFGVRLEPEVTIVG
jgi:UDP-N-acetylmuramate dehydrogenase